MIVIAKQAILLLGLIYTVAIIKANLFIGYSLLKVKVFITTGDLIATVDYSLGIQHGPPSGTISLLVPLNENTFSGFDVKFPESNPLMGPVCQQNGNLISS